MKPTIAVINASSSTPDAIFPSSVAAIGRQVSGDFAPYWSKDATLVFVPKGHAPPVGSWQVVCADTIDVAGALGYHDRTKEGLPLGKVGIQTSQSDGVDWRVPLSHEVLEMLGDPDIIRAAFFQTTESDSVVLAYEACDAVEEATYEIDGVPVSDFVTQEWFEPSRSGVPFSFKGTVTRPLTLAPGGYIGIFRVRGGSWGQITARKEHYAAHQGHVLTIASEWEDDSHVIRYSKIPRVGSRRERRSRPRAAWIASVT